MDSSMDSIFINRELSWLDFNSRVLALAKDKGVPLGERLKFEAIFGSNLDEFFMVRVGSLYDQTLLKNNKPDIVTHMTASEQIAAITFTKDYKKAIRDSWNVWDVIATLGVVALCALFYAYFW